MVSKLMKSHRKANWIIFLGLVSLSLTGCGFQPLYEVTESGQSASTELAKVEVRPIKARLGQVVYNSLINEITPLGNPVAPSYALEMVLEESREGLGFEDDDTVTRFNYTLVGEFRLIDVPTGAIVLKSSSRSIAAYNVVDNQFATLTARQDAQVRAARDLSQSVKLQLALFFRQNQ